MNNNNPSSVIMVDGLLSLVSVSLVVIPSPSPVIIMVSPVVVTMLLVTIVTMLLIMMVTMVTTASPSVLVVPIIPSVIPISGVRVIT